MFTEWVRLLDNFGHKNARGQLIERKSDVICRIIGTALGLLI